MAKPNVSLAMIVRNGAATLPACLDSARALVDEMVVVDTGSTDDSIEIARSRGARVLSVPWRDDFSVARNACVRAARGRWILSLDADEVVEAPASDLPTMLSRHPRSVFVCTIRNYFALSEWSGPLAPSGFGGEVEAGVGWTPSRTIRILPRLRRLTYRYPVHESLLPAARALGLAIKSCGLKIHHMGFLRPAADRKAKREVYRALGLKKLVQYPRCFLGYLELGRLCLAEGEIEDAERRLTQCLRLNPFCSAAHYDLIMAALRSGRPEQARRRVTRGLRLLPRNTDLLYARGLVELELGEEPDAMASLAPALQRMPLADRLFGGEGPVGGDHP